MPNVLTIASTVLCGTAVTGPPPRHGGSVTKLGTPKLTISDNQVLLDGSLSTVSSCKNAPPPQGSIPCPSVTVIAPTSKATKLTVGGKPVLLDTLTGTASGNPPGSLAAEAKQTKLSTI